MFLQCDFFFSHVGLKESAVMSHADSPLLPEVEDLISWQVGVGVQPGLPVNVEHVVRSFPLAQNTLLIKNKLFL